MIPVGYENYIEDGVRTRDIQLDHWSETLEIVQMTKRYNGLQFAEKITKGNPGQLWEYKNRYRLPNRESKTRIIAVMKELIKEPHQINTTIHGRAYR